MPEPWFLRDAPEFSGCLEALQGQGDAATARQAFKDAAEEAGILIGDAFRPSPKPKKRKR
jgi:hypothetical protein